MEKITCNVSNEVLIVSDINQLLEGDLHEEIVNALFSAWDMGCRQILAVVSGQTKKGDYGYIVDLNIQEDDEFQIMEFSIFVQFKINKFTQLGPVTGNITGSYNIAFM